MAGGMRRRGDRLTLAERVHAHTPSSASPSPYAAPSRVKPCWVTDGHGQNPGLLLEWRQVAAGWQGRVVRPVYDGSAWIVVEEWLPAELLTP
jgi:hypothetical protein